MRTMRLMAAPDGRDLLLRDEQTGALVPDVVRIEVSPIEYRDRQITAVVYVHERDLRGNLMYQDGEPVRETMFVRLVPVTVWDL